MKKQTTPLEELVKALVQGMDWIEEKEEGHENDTEDN